MACVVELFVVTWTAHHQANWTFPQTILILMQNVSNYQDVRIWLSLKWFNISHYKLSPRAMPIDAFCVIKVVRPKSLHVRFPYMFPNLRQTKSAVGAYCSTLKRAPVGSGHGS